VLTNPPLLVIEILSPDDTYSGLEDRVHDYQTMGVKNIWLIDPIDRVGRTRANDAWSAATMRLAVENSPIYVDLNDIFKFLDRPR
jgi:Uma2 family endonuclease